MVILFILQFTIATIQPIKNILNFSVKRFKIKKELRDLNFVIIELRNVEEVRSYLNFSIPTGVLD